MVRDCVAGLVKLLPRQWQPLVVLPGAILVHIALGTIYTFGNMLPYMVSYQNVRVSQSITETSFTWLLTAQAGLQCLAVGFGGWLERRMGARFTVLIGAFIMCSGVFATHWTIRHSFAALLITYGVLFGIGMGLSYNAAIVCAMKWLPKCKGLASGVVLLGFGCGAFVFNPVQTHYVNPWNYKPNCEHDGKMYFCQSDLLDKVPYLFLILAASYATMEIIGSIVLFDPDEDEEQAVLVGRDSVFVHPKDAVKSPTLYILWLTFFCNSQTTYLITALYKRFGEGYPVLNDDTYLAWVGSTASIFNAIGRPFWGYIGDKFSFQVAMSILTSGVAVLMLTLRTTPYGGQGMFIVWMCGIYFFLCGSFSLFPMVTAKCFGQKYVGINYGMVMTSVTVSGVISSLLTKILLSDIGYEGMFFLVAGFSAFGFVLTVFIQKSKHGKGVEVAESYLGIENPNYDQKDPPDEDDPFEIWNQ